MLSPSLSSNSLEQSTTLSTSIIAPSESSNSGPLISSSDLNINNGGCFPHAGSTPLIDNSYGHHDYNNVLLNSSMPYSIPSTSGDKALYVVNPCYQSAIFHRQSNDLTASTYSSNNTEVGQNHKNALRPLQNIRSAKMPSHGLLPQQPPPPRNLSTRRTISLQIVRPFPLYDDGSCSSSSLSSSKTTAAFSSPTKATKCYSTNSKGNQLYIGNQSASVMNFLNESSLAELTKLFQKYSSNPSTISPRWLNQIKNLRAFVLQIRAKSQNSEKVNKMEAISGKENGYNLCKIPLGTIQAETHNANPLPQFVHDIMDFITGQADLAKDIFRRPGTSSQIDRIIEICSKLAPNQSIPNHLLDDSQIYDLASALKLYFRKELPERLFTNRLSKMLENVVVELPRECHFTALHFCVLLLPAENREALFILLKFLKGISRHSATNLMNSLSLAVSWMPTIFHFSQEENDVQPNGAAGTGTTIRQKLMRRKTIGIPSEKDNKAFKGIQQISTEMIDHWEQLTRIPDAFTQKIADKGLNDCLDLSVPLKNGKFEFTEDLHLNFRRQLFRLEEDYSENWKGWELQRVFSDGTLLFTSSKNDLIPLKCFRVQITIAAASNLILNTILRARNLYDPNIEESKRVGPSGTNFDIIRVQYGKTLDTPQCKYSFLTRRWRYSADSVCCSLIECSIIPRCMDRHASSNVSVFESKFLIHETCPGHSSLNYISRIDLRGKPSEWYDRVYGEMLVNQMRRLRQCVYKIRFNPRGTIV